VDIGTVLEIHDEVRVVDVFDPDGNRLQLVQQLKL
jgi:predicted enzyme related to lactoylglutathione lyase